MIIAWKLFVTINNLRHAGSILFQIVLRDSLLGLTVYPNKDLWLIIRMRLFDCTVWFEHLWFLLCLIFILIILNLEIIWVSLNSVVIFKGWSQYNFIAILSCDLLVGWHWVCVECLWCPLLVNDFWLFVHFRMKVVKSLLFIVVHFFHHLRVSGFESLMFN